VKIQISLKSDNNNGYFTCRPIYISINLIFFKFVTQFFLELKTLQTKVVEKIEVQTSCSILSSQNRAVYEIMWENKVEPDATHDTMAHLHCMLGS